MEWEPHPCAAAALSGTIRAARGDSPERMLLLHTHTGTPAVGADEKVLLPDPLQDYGSWLKKWPAVKDGSNLGSGKILSLKRILYPSPHTPGP